MLSTESSDYLLPQPVWLLPPFLLVSPHPSPGPPLTPSSPFLSNQFNFVCLTLMYFYFVPWWCSVLPRRREFSGLGGGFVSFLKQRWETTRGKEVKPEPMLALQVVNEQQRSIKFVFCWKETTLGVISGHSAFWNKESPRVARTKQVGVWPDRRSFLWAKQHTCPLKMEVSRSCGFRFWINTNQSKMTFKSLIEHQWISNMRNTFAGV